LVSKCFCSKRISCSNTKRIYGQIFFGPSAISASWGIGREVAIKQAFVIPDDFEITWLSMVERKFYRGKWILPKNKIENYLEKGLDYQNKKVKCNKIQIGLAPKGVVVVWLLGEHGMQIEIGKYQADQIILESKDVYNSSKFMFEKGFIDKKLVDTKFIAPEIQENIRKNGYPEPTIYNLYRKKYIWEPKVILPDSCSISSINIKMCNGENETAKDASSITIEGRSVPYLFNIVWKDKNGREFLSKIVFLKQVDWKKYFTNEKEELPLNFDKNSILNQFTQKIKKDIPAQIIIKIDNKSVSDFYLEQEEKKYQIIEFKQQTKQLLKKKALYL
jgi:hypothetical protein